MGVKVNVICNLCMRKMGEKEIPAYFEDYFQMAMRKHTCLACKHKKGKV